jgi:hypothetical protein
MFRSETCLLLLGVLDGLGEVGQSISHLSSSDVGRGVLESLKHDGSVQCANKVVMFGIEHMLLVRV